MPTTLDSIQKKHEETIRRLSHLASYIGMTLPGAKITLQEITEQLDGIFTELLDYHKRYTTAAKTAAEIAGKQ